MDRQTEKYLEDVYESKKELFDKARKISDDFGFMVSVDDISDTKEGYEALLKYLNENDNLSVRDVGLYIACLDNIYHPEKYLDEYIEIDD